jgi:hypothetical protein
MKNGIIRRLGLRLSVSALLFLAQMSSFAPVPSAAHPLERLAQFCVSPPDGQVGAPRVYCHYQDTNTPT